MIKLLLPWLLLLISSCAIGVNNFSSIEKSSDFFLCFPETDQAYSQLTLIDKISIQKKIAFEKERREVNCDFYTNYVSGEENLKQINKEEMRRKIGSCRYRHEPCRYD